ncbi:MAG: hypothetical protein ACREEL_11430 [Stellaceae bacterium]
MDAFTAVDRLLAGRFQVGLEDMLCEGCLTGQLPALFAGDAAIAPRCTRMLADGDGGRSFTFEGTFTLADVRYNFRCHVFADAGGQRFISDVALFEPVEWQAQIAM